MVDVLILNYVDYETTQELVDSIKNYKSVNHICIVDNASPNDSYEQLKRNNSKKISVIKTPRNGGYGYGNNFGLLYLHKNFKSKYILLCNPDVIVDDFVISCLENFLKENSSYIIAAPFMLDAKGIKQKNTAFKIGSLIEYILSYGLLYSKIFKPGEYKNIILNDTEVLDVEAVAGSLFMFDADKMIEVALYDENVFLYCEERIQGIKCKNANMKIALLPQCTFIHNHSVSINKTIKSEIKKRKIMNDSALYVIKEYYKGNRFEIILAKLFMLISIIEIDVLNKIKGKRRY